MNWKEIFDSFAWFFVSPKSHRGRRHRAGRLMAQGYSRAASWGIVIMRDLDRGVTNFTDEEREIAREALDGGPIYLVPDTRSGKVK